MIFISTLYLFLVSVLGGVHSDGIWVKVKQGWLSGERVQGVMDNTSYYSFKGIPYAKPPVGSLRFKAPQEADAWDGVRNATEHGSICPQFSLTTDNELVLATGTSEDCLFLNVYSPNIKANHLLPVIVFIHGGGFASGSGNVDNYGPDFLIAQDVVVVTMNYRLGALGFLSLGTKEVPGNAALKDQNLALKWVQKNIENFGGNPNNVTLMGQSAGAALVALHVISPMSKGLFQRVICLSSVSLCDFAIAHYPERRAYALAKTLGFRTSNTTDPLTFLQSISFNKLLNTTSHVLASEQVTDFVTRVIPFAPVIERNVGQVNIFLSQNPFEALTCENIDVDVILGYTSHECISFIPNLELFMSAYDNYPQMFVPSKIEYRSTYDLVLNKSSIIQDHYFDSKDVSMASMQELVNYCSNASFIYDIHRFGRKVSKCSNVYLYKYTIISSRNYYSQQGSPYNITGPAHSDDLLCFFDAKALNMTLTNNSTEYEMIKRCTTLITNYAKYGHPTPDSSLGVIWPTYNKKSLKYLEFGDTLSVKSRVDETDVQFWKEIFVSSNIPW